MNRAVFLPASAGEAYRGWLTFWEIAEPIERSGLTNWPDGAVRWSTRWGVTQIDGHAEFIPAQGGCVMYLTLTGAGMLSCLLLWAMRPVQRSLWRSVERFRYIVEGAAEPEPGTINAA
ncbi:MAG TPA: hypothetical protein VFY10_02005 [Dehalococcoidia bacterium]|nr:hypothetical protein [Dehalococcoidia bacterium]